MRLGFVGAGRMGRPMVERLVAAGHQVSALGRSTRAREELEKIGARPVATAGEAAGGAEAVIVCAFDDEQVREVCLGPDLPARMADAAVLVVHTTGSPATVQAIASRGIPVIDAPVSGGPHDIAAGRITLFLGGADDDVAKVRPALSAYGDPVLHVGALGAGQRVKLVNNALFAAHIGLLSHAVRLGDRLGVDEASLLEALTHGSSASKALAGVSRRGSVAAFARSTGEFLSKDVAAVQAMAAELGGDLGALEPALRALADATRNGTSGEAPGARGSTPGISADKG